MISLQFRIEPRYLVYHTFKGSVREGTDWKPVVAFQNRGWEMDQEAYNLLIRGIPEDTILAKTRLEELGRRADCLLETIVADPTYIPIINATEDALNKLRSEWESNYARTYNLVEKLTGLKLTGEHVVLVTHPALNQGHNSNGTICFTHRNDWPNYNTIYLWHELLHGFIPENDLEHAVIQLITDNELRTILNGGNYPPFEGHPYLTKLMELLLPDWQNYLKSKDPNVTDFISTQALNPTVKQELSDCRKHRHGD